MHLLKNSEESLLVLDDRNDVAVANMATRLAGGTFMPEASVVSWPFTRDGEFPKHLTREDSALVLAGIQRALGQDLSEFQQMLTDPFQHSASTPAHIAVRAAFLQSKKNTS